MSFSVNLSQCSPYNDGVKVYKSLWQYLHSIRASNRPDIVSRISLASNVAVISSMADGAVGNVSWISNNQSIVKNAVERYYKSHVSDLTNIIEKVKSGITIRCVMMDKYMVPPQTDFVGGVIRDIVNTTIDVKKINIATESTTTVKQQEEFEQHVNRGGHVQSVIDKPDDDVQIVHFKPTNEEEKTDPTDDGTFAQLNKMFWRSQNDRRPDTMARQKQNPKEIVTKMHERARIAARNSFITVQKPEAPAQSKPEAINSFVLVSNKKNVPPIYNVIVSTENIKTDTATNDATNQTEAIENLIYFPIDAAMDFSIEIVSRFFKAVSTLSKTKKIYIIATNDVAPFISTCLMKLNVGVNTDVPGGIDPILKDKVESVIQAVTSLKAPAQTIQVS